MKMEWIERVGAYDYLENSIQSICHNVAEKKTLMDSISECRITRFLANIRSLLDDYGKTHAVNSRSSIRVDKDYWYMRGKYMYDKESDKGWPCSSVFIV